MMDRLRKLSTAPKLKAARHWTQKAGWRRRTAEALFFTAQVPQLSSGSASTKPEGGDQEKIRPENCQTPPEARSRPRSGAGRGKDRGKQEPMMAKRQMPSGNEIVETGEKIDTAGFDPNARIWDEQVVDGLCRALDSNVN